MLYTITEGWRNGVKMSRISGELTIDYQEGFRDGVRAVMTSCMMHDSEQWPQIISDLLQRENEVLKDMLEE